LRDTFPHGLESSSFSPVVAARSIHEMNRNRTGIPISEDVENAFYLLEGGKSEIKAVHWEENRQLVLALFDIYCLKAYFKCYSHLHRATSPSNLDLNYVTRVANKIEEACDVVDSILWRYVVDPFPPGQPLKLRCGGYFLDGEWSRHLLEDYRSIKLPHHSRPEGHAPVSVSALLHLRERNLGSNFVIDLGAGLMMPGDLGSCEVDPADCLVFQHGFHGLLFEGDTLRSTELLSRYNGSDQKVLNGIMRSERPNRVFVFADYIDPESIRGTVDKILLQDFKEHNWKGSFFPDLLKIDVDNGDCEFLEQLLWNEKDAGERSSFLRPIFIDIEAQHFILPPNFAYRRNFDHSFTSGSMPYFYGSTLMNMARGCSLGEVLRVVGQDYVLYALDHESPRVELIHRAFIHLLPESYRGIRNLNNYWQETFFPADSIYHENVLLGYPFPAVQIYEGLFNATWGQRRDLHASPTRLVEFFHYLELHYDIVASLLHRPSSDKQFLYSSGSWQLRLFTPDWVDFERYVI